MCSKKSVKMSKSVSSTAAVHKLHKAWYVIQNDFKLIVNDLTFNTSVK